MSGMDVVQLSRLDLGQDRAEAETEGLENYFIPTPVYLNAKNPTRRKSYYIGQRGAGKTALFEKLAEDFGKSGHDVVIRVTPEDFSYERFADLEHEYVNLQSVYGYVWHYTLITDIFRNVVQHFDDRPYLKTHRANADALRKYLLKKNVRENEGFLDTFLTYFGEFTSNRNVAKAMKIGGGEINKDFRDLANLHELQNELRTLHLITAKHPVYLFIDELDSGWDNTKEARNFIHGLFYAIKKVKLLPNVTVFVSLRSDMYNDLSSILPDPEKMRSDVEKFYWTPGMLKELISERIIYSFNLEGDDALSRNAISTVFEDGVLDYIIDHTLHRPREVIQFCNQILSRAGTEYHSANILEGETRGRIDMRIVRSVEPEFSDARFQDTCREYEHQFPGLLTFLSQFANGSIEYSMGDFLPKLEDVMLQLSEQLGSGSWLANNFHAEKVMDILFEIGFIKLYSDRENRFLGYYEGRFPNKLNVAKLRIHDVFVSALQCHDERIARGI